MKKLVKVLKYFFIVIISLVVLMCAGLLIYYHSIYEDTLLPAEVSALPSLKSQLKTTNSLQILPIPKKLIYSKGFFYLPDQLYFSAPVEDTQTIANVFFNHLNIQATSKNTSNVQFIKNKSIEIQAYIMRVEPSGIEIEYNDLAGMFYGLTTLKQLALITKNHIPCLQIEDKPDMKIRGAMLDISRNKIPTLETLYGIVDFLADLKYNQLQLYIEGFSFAYPSFKNLWAKTETPLKPDEIKQLDKYCKDRFIELVPNQNSLGHMAAWLETDEFKDLAECPDGYKFLGVIDMKTTMAPSNPRTLELVKKMSEDLLPNFTSDKFNVNLDEPFELGKNPDKPIKDEKEIARIYIDYAKKLNEFVNIKGKSMMMWGDVVSKNPEIISEIPKNITLLEWGYEADHPFKNICPIYKNAGLKYLVCPGTSSWSSFTGRTANMMGNIENAVGNGIENNAEGMLITDWGDFGHLQYITASYAGLAYGAALSWNFKSKSEIDLGGYLSKIAFNDDNLLMGELALELGRYNQFEEYPMVAMTTTGMSYMFGIIDKTMSDAVFSKMQSSVFELLTTDIEYKEKLKEQFDSPKIYHAGAIIKYVDSLESILPKTHLRRADSSLIIAEYKNSIKMIKLGAKLKHFNNYHLQQTAEENRALLTEMKDLCNIIIPEHERLWNMRNKTGRLDLSLQSLNKVNNQIDDELQNLDKNAIMRWIIRSKAKIISAGAVLYLK